MIDFKNAKYLKLKPVDNRTYDKMLSPLLVNDEEIVSSFQTFRDGVVFTNKRIIAINVQGLTGSKKDFTSLPYSKVQAYSVETSGAFDMDGELTLWFSGLGLVRLEFATKVDLAYLCRIISGFVL